MSSIPNPVAGHKDPAIQTLGSLVAQLQNEAKAFANQFRIGAWQDRNGAWLLLVQAKKLARWQTVAALDNAGKLYLASSSAVVTGTNFDTVGWNPSTI